VITTVAQAQAIVDFAKALGFTDAKLLFWDAQAIQGIDDIPGHVSPEDAMDNYGEEEGLCEFSLGIQLGAVTYLKRDGKAIKSILPIAKGRCE
jgi:hypothetical protein